MACMIRMFSIQEWADLAVNLTQSEVPDPREDPFADDDEGSFE